MFDTMIDRILNSAAKLWHKFSYAPLLLCVFIGVQNVSAQGLVKYTSKDLAALSVSTISNKIAANDTTFLQDYSNIVSGNSVLMDSTNKALIRKKRTKWVAAAHIVGLGGAMYGLYNAWYKNYPQQNFQFFNDNGEWLQVDKVGHMYSAYIESKASMELWRWAGVSRKQRIWYGGLTGVGYQTMIEVLDGFSEGWGWSWGDFTANVLGSGLLVTQELLWNEQRVDMKFSFHQEKYHEPDVQQRADSLFGKGVLSRMLKDYNGQTYWLSFNIKSFFPATKLPAWLNIAVGYGASGLLDADENIWKDRQGNLIDRTDIPRYRKWYIAPDINLTKIKTKSKLLKAALFCLNSFKFPLPSIGFSKKGIEWNWIHF